MLKKSEIANHNGGLSSVDFFEAFIGKVQQPNERYSYSHEIETAYAWIEEPAVPSDLNLYITDTVSIRESNSEEIEK